MKFKIFTIEKDYIGLGWNLSCVIIPTTITLHIIRSWSSYIYSHCLANHKSSFFNSQFVFFHCIQLVKRDYHFAHRISTHLVVLYMGISLLRLNALKYSLNSFLIMRRCEGTYPSKSICCQELTSYCILTMHNLKTMYERLSNWVPN